MDEVSPKIIGSFPANDSSGDRVDVYENMSYRYEPKFTLSCFPNSLLKIENNDVYYKHPKGSNTWYGSHQDYFARNVLKIVIDYAIEDVLLNKGENSVND